MKTKKYFSSILITPESFVNNRAINYGDGIFETMLVDTKIIRMWSYHMERLFASIDRLKMRAINEKRILKDIQSIVPDNKQYIVKLVVYRAGNKRGYASHSQKTEYFITINPYLMANMQDILTVSDMKLSQQKELAGLKHLNRLEQVLAANKLEDSQYSDAIMCDQDGCVIETINKNIILFKDDRIYTPCLENSGVFGVALRWLEAQGINLYRKKIEFSELSAYHGMMVCNSIHGFIAIKNIDGNIQFNPQLPMMYKIQQLWLTATT